MPQFDTGEIVAILSLAVGVLVWLVRLEGKVNMHEDRLNRNDKTHEETRGDIQYIRQRIDEALTIKATAASCVASECPFKHNVKELDEQEN